MSIGKSSKRLLAAMLSLVCALCMILLVLPSLSFAVHAGGETTVYAMKVMLNGISDNATRGEGGAKIHQQIANVPVNSTLTFSFDYYYEILDKTKAQPFSMGIWDSQLISAGNQKSCSTYNQHATASISWNNGAQTTVCPRILFPTAASEGTLYIWNIHLTDAANTEFLWDACAAGEMSEGGNPPTAGWCCATNGYGVTAIETNNVRNYQIVTLDEKYYMTSQKMLAIDLDGITSTVLYQNHNFGDTLPAGINGKTMTFDFDYYLSGTDKAASLSLYFANNANWAQKVDKADFYGACQVKAHASIATTVSANNYNVYLSLPSGTTGTLYIWNMSWTLEDGTELLYDANLTEASLSTADGGWRVPAGNAALTEQADSSKFVVSDLDPLLVTNNAMNVVLKDINVPAEGSGASIHQEITVPANTDITFSFDYFQEVEDESKASPFTAILAWNGYTSKQEASCSVMNSHKRMSMTVNTGEYTVFYPQLTFAPNTDGIVHIWNMQVTDGDGNQYLWDSLSAGHMNPSTEGMGWLSTTNNGVNSMIDNYSVVELNNDWLVEKQFVTKRMALRTSSTPKMLVLDLSKATTASYKSLLNSISGDMTDKNLTFSFDYFYDVPSGTPGFSIHMRKNGLANAVGYVFCNKIREQAHASISYNSTANQSVWVQIGGGSDQRNSVALPNVEGKLYVWNLKVVAADAPSVNILDTNGDTFTLATESKWGADGWFGSGSAATILPADYAQVASLDLTKFTTTTSSGTGTTVKPGTNMMMQVQCKYSYNGFWQPFIAESNTTYTFSFDYYTTPGENPTALARFTNGSQNLDSSEQTKLPSQVHLYATNKIQTATITYKTGTIPEDTRYFAGFCTGFNKDMYIYAWNFKLVKSTDTSTNMLKNPSFADGTLNGWCPTFYAINDGRSSYEGDFQVMAYDESKFTSLGVTTTKRTTKATTKAPRTTTLPLKKMDDPQYMLEYHNDRENPDSPGNMMKYVTITQRITLDINKKYTLSCNYYCTPNTTSLLRIFRSHDSSDLTGLLKQTVFGHYMEGTARIDFSPTEFLEENSTSSAYLRDTDIKNGKAEFSIGISPGGLGYGYVWNFCLTEVGSDVNLFNNYSFGTGTFEGWNRGMASEDIGATADAYPHSVVPFNRDLWKDRVTTTLPQSGGGNPNINFDFNKTNGQGVSLASKNVATQFRDIVKSLGVENNDSLIRIINAGNNGLEMSRQVDLVAGEQYTYLFNYCCEPGSTIEAGVYYDDGTDLVYADYVTLEDDAEKHQYVLTFTAEGDTYGEAAYDYYVYLSNGETVGSGYMWNFLMVSGDGTEIGDDFFDDYADEGSGAITGNLVKIFPIVIIMVLAAGLVVTCMIIRRRKNEPLKEIQE